MTHNPKKRRRVTTISDNNMNGAEMDRIVIAGISGLAAAALVIDPNLPTHVLIAIMTKSGVGTFCSSYLSGAAMQRRRNNIDKANGNSATTLTAKVKAFLLSFR